MAHYGTIKGTTIPVYHIKTHSLYSIKAHDIEPIPLAYNIVSRVWISVMIMIITII